MASRNRSGNEASAICLSLLVPTLLLCAFILSAVGTVGKDWTWRVEKDSDTLECMGIDHRSPFQYCNIAPRKNRPNLTTTTTTASDTADTSAATDDSSDMTTSTASSSATATITACPDPDSIRRWKETCTRAMKPGGACAVETSHFATTLGRDATGDTSRFCQQLILSGSLLIAGCALLGIGMLGSFVLAGASLLQLSRGDGTPADPSSPLMPMMSLFTSLVAGLGFLAMMFGTVIGANNLVNLQFPAGDWFTSGDNTANTGATGPWLMGKSVGIASAGWVMAAVGASLVGKVWPGPMAYHQRVGQDEVDEQTVGGCEKQD